MNTSSKSVGIEAIAFDVPSCYVDISDLAQARGIDPAKFTKGLGQREMAVATPQEDTVVLAACAGQRLMLNFAVDPQSIGLVVVGTETSVDQSKPVAAYVHQVLELSPRCRAFEIKHACYGAMAGVQMATDWILSGRANGKKALVIASDIARYGAGTAGEPTQGAGAVAMLVSDEPRLLKFETGHQGYFTKQVMDFWRPNYSKEAFADGHYSIECYLSALVESYEMYMPGEREFLNHQRACLYHAPFVKMAQKAHLRLLEHVGGAALVAGSPEHAAALADYKARVEPYLELCARVGNVYTGSLWLSLIGLLEDGVFSGENRSISLFSYGSGCVAEFMTGQVGAECADIMRRHPFRAQLHARKRLTVAEYEKVLEASAKMDANGSFVDIPADSPRRVIFAGVKDHRRRYFADGAEI